MGASMNNSEFEKENYTIDDLQRIVAKLRAEDGCPWDKVQTHESLKSCLIEECYEVIEAINRNDEENLIEELGDVLLQVYMHSQIASEQDRFSIDEVTNQICQKLIRRHPHVFGTAIANNTQESLANWEGIKKLEKQGKKEENLPLKTIPQSLPALIRAQKVIKKVDKVYGHNQSAEKCIQNVINNLENLKKNMSEMKKNNNDFLLGDMMLQIVNLSSILEENAENSLTNRVETFINIFEGNNC